MKTNRVIGKIEALLAKTVENGSTEDEAFSAMQMAKRLMLENGITEEDLRSKVSEDYVTVFVNYRNKIIVDYCAVTVAKLAEVEVFRSGDTIAFFGFEDDVKFATMAFGIIEHYCTKGWKEFLKTHEARGYKVHKNFVKYYAIRIRARIQEFIDANKIEFSSNSTDLVVLKGQIIKEELASRIQLQKGRKARASKKPKTNDEFVAATAGYQAANNAVIALNSNDIDRTKIE